MPEPTRGRPPICDIELRSYANAIGRLRRAQHQLHSIRTTIRHINRRIERRLEEQEAERRPNRSPLNIQTLSEGGIPNGGFDQPGVPFGAQAAYQLGELLRDASQLSEEDNDYAQLRRAHRQRLELEGEITNLERRIQEMRVRLDANGCRYNRAL